MHKLCEMAEDKIKDLTKHGINSSNLKAVGELVDIIKDIKNMWYWEEKLSFEEDDSSGIFKTVSDKSKVLQKHYERYRNSNSPHDKAKVKELADEMLGIAEMVHSSLSDIMDNEIVTKMRRIFK